MNCTSWRESVFFDNGFVIFTKEIIKTVNLEEDLLEMIIFKGKRRRQFVAIKFLVNYDLFKLFNNEI